MLSPGCEPSGKGKSVPRRYSCEVDSCSMLYVCLSAPVPAVLCSLVELNLRKGFVGHTASESLHWKYEKMVSVP